ncbi:MAG TPA: hypothetical protein VNL96_09925 [Gemmatimonadaceae bacterium]|nr:hypothetical protein [Gemmatimonadaceae bacterium]
MNPFQGQFHAAVPAAVPGHVQFVERWMVEVFVAGAGTLGRLGTTLGVRVVLF